MWTILALLAASVVGSVIGAVATNSAQKKANETNLELNRENNETNIQLAKDEMAFNSAEAEKQRQFELNMSSTAVQRRMEDLKAAGVNPMLAVGDPAQMASGYAASASSVRTNAGHVEPVNGFGDSMNAMASMAQSAAFMMALSKIKTDNANIYANSRKEVANINASSRTRGWKQYNWRLQDGSYLTERRY